MPAANIVAAERTLREARPVAFYTWSGLTQHSDTTQTIRAVNVLYALTGSLDVPGGNVLFEAVSSHPVDGMEFLSDARPTAVGEGPFRMRVRYELQDFAEGILFAIHATGSPGRSSAGQRR